MNQEEQKIPAIEDIKESGPKARKEAEKAAKEKARLEAEEAKQRARREAEEAREKAKRDSEEAKKAREAEAIAKREAEKAAKEKARLEAEEAKQRAVREAEEAREKAKRDSEEAKKAREAEKRAKKEEASKGKTIAADDSELFSGAITLMVNQGTHGNNIMNLIQSLSADINIKVMSSGGALGKNPWISLSIQNSIPLFKVLYKVPVVQTVTRKGDTIMLTLNEGELIYSQGQ
jgi:membrane protein involved in colicin uptake